MISENARVFSLLCIILMFSPDLLLFLLSFSSFIQLRTEVLFSEDFSNAHAQPIHPLGYRGIAILVYLKVVSCISPHFSYLGSVAIKRRGIATPPQCVCLVKKTKRGWGANCIGRCAFLYDFLNLFSSPATQFNIVPRYYSHLCYFLS